MLAAGRLDYRNSSPWCYELSLAEGGGCLKRHGNCRCFSVGDGLVNQQLKKSIQWASTPPSHGVVN
ncbi:hypothetical protein OIU79_010537 [Salix purpurea]|uniref:Uncharacterized protein n=1 Tax=Salix purpurea TaxID=77065 RepID=A0A9Q0QG96_SALPP|nr:hypothetical protein OIU79_010537 [Salix purpurea]